MEQVIRVHEVTGIYCGSKKINSLGRKRLLQTQNFEKKGKNSNEENVLAFFPLLSNMTIAKERP